MFRINMAAQYPGYCYTNILIYASYVDTTLRTILKFLMVINSKVIEPETEKRL